MSILLGIWKFLTSLPWWIYAAALIVMGVWAYGVHQHHMGYAEATAKYEASIAAQKAAYEKQVADLEAKQQQVITKTVIEYRDRVKVVKEKGDEIVKEVPVLVPLDSPLLGGGVRVAHDAAASGVLPDDPQGAAAAAAPVETAALVATVAENYKSCRLVSEQLIALQKIVSSLERTP